MGPDNPLLGRRTADTTVSGDSDAFGYILPVVLASFHPTVARWFRETFGAPSPPQVQGWPEIGAGHHTLIAAPTGSGKTLAAFLHAIDQLMRQGRDLGDQTQVLYISPLKGAMDPFLPEVRVLVRTGDTPQKDRAAMLRKPPHILVTTPESLYILLTTERGRGMLQNVRRISGTSPVFLIGPRTPDDRSLRV